MKPLKCTQYQEAIETFCLKMIDKENKRGILCSHKSQHNEGYCDATETQPSETLALSFVNDDKSSLKLQHMQEDLVSYNV